MFANIELSQFHERLHEIFTSLLSEVVEDVPENDQVRFVLQSPQLDSPISLPFLHASQLTTERILAEIERVVQSNHEFRLNDSVNVNVIHVEMPRGERVQNVLRLIWKSIWRISGQLFGSRIGIMFVWPGPWLFQLQKLKRIVGIVRYGNRTDHFRNV
jgi:hypothetical protein